MALTTRQYLRLQGLEKRVRALDAVDIAEWVLRLEDVAEALEESLGEPIRIMKEDRDALLKSAPDDEDTLESVEIYNEAITDAELAIKAWRNFS